jgi:MATE family multidrug resistance protein
MVASDRARSSFPAELRRTVQLALPIMLGQAGQMLMALTDTLVVGHLGVTPLAASAFAGSIVTMLFVFGIGILTSIAVIGSQAHGAGLSRRKQDLLRTALCLSLGLGSLLAIAVWLSGPILSVFGQPVVVLAAAKPFLIVLAWSLVPGLGFIAVRSYCESLGRPTVPMLILYASVVLNLVLNILLVFGYCGAPRLGLLGAAHATLWSRSAAMLLTLFYSIKITGMSWKQLFPARLDQRLFRTLLEIGTPVGLQYLAEVGAFSFSAIMMGWISASTLAAHQIAITCAATTFMFPLGVAQAVTIRIGHALGSGETARTKIIGWGGLAASAMIMGCSAVGFATWHHQIARLFSSDTEVVSIAGLLVFVAGVFQLADGLQVTATGALRGLADVRIPMWIAGWCYWGLAIPVAYLGGFVFKFGALGIWCGLALGLFVAATVFTVRFSRLAETKTAPYMGAREFADGDFLCR